jgi:lysine-N-methylase
MSVSRSLPVILPEVATQRWACHSCTECCRTPIAFVSEDERSRIDAQRWADRLGTAPYVRCGGQWALNKRADGACVFLDQQNRCMIHNEFGPEAKPLACRMFPFALRPARGGWRASVRFDCPSVARSVGDPLRPQLRELQCLAASLPMLNCDDRVDLRSGIPATEEEATIVTSRLLRWLQSGDTPPAARLVGGAEVVSILAQTRFQEARGQRLAELLDLLLAATKSPVRESVEPAKPRYRGLLRQLAFAHAEFLTLDELRAGGWLRWTRRWRQLRAARRFRHGLGLVPPLPGWPAKVPFEHVERVMPCTRSGQDGQRVAELVVRYLSVRLSQRSVFGAGYYGWSVVDGLAALWLAVPVIGWLSRLSAASAGRDEISYDDAVRAVGVVDRAATRVPALGGHAERIRARYLLLDDGLNKLLHFYAPFSLHESPDANAAHEE